MAKSNILGFHGRQGDFSLKLAFPENRATSKKNDVTSTTAHTMRFVGVFMVVKTSEICIGVLRSGRGRIKIPLS